MQDSQGQREGFGDAEAALVDEARSAGREPVWCHHCGSYSFLDEWDVSNPHLVEGRDVCPVCGDVWPAGAKGPLADTGYLDLAVAALGHEVAW